MRRDLSVYRIRIFEAESKRREQEKPELKAWRSKVFDLQEKLVMAQEQLKNQECFSHFFHFAVSLVVLHSTKLFYLLNI